MGGNNNSDPLDIVLFQESSKRNSWYNVAAKEIAEAGYLLGKLYDLDESKYGSSSELRQAVQAFHQNGVRCVSDIVINQRIGSKQDDKGNWCIFEGGTDDNCLDWGTWAIPINDKPYSCGS
ncbi:hypothetical protein SUGI_0078050 [Cryptomeria japonica]|nr:hypothetical protein SUGI_0078050 [Cryptomeria japonica]